MSEAGEDELSQVIEYEKELEEQTRITVGGEFASDDEDDVQTAMTADSDDEDDWSSSKAMPKGQMGSTSISDMQVCWAEEPPVWYCDWAEG